MIEHIAVIGMGQMCSAMASRLSQSQYDVMGYDISDKVRQDLTDRSVKMADNLAAALAGRTTVLTSLPDAAWLGADGIAALAEPNSLIIELSTIDPTTMGEVAAAAAAKGHAVLDCPVSGSPTEAATPCMSTDVSKNTSAVPDCTKYASVAISPCCVSVSPACSTRSSRSLDVGGTSSI